MSTFKEIMIDDLTNKVKHYAHLATLWLDYNSEVARFYFEKADDFANRAQHVIAETPNGKNMLESYALRLVMNR